MSLKVPAQLIEAVHRAAEKAFPEECCGFLIGAVPNGFEKPGRTVMVEEIQALPNGWEAGSRTHRYQIDPKIFAKTEAELSGTGKGIVGLYHSHPSVPAWPSPFDLMMAWPCYSYWIVSVIEGKIHDSRSWMRGEDGRNFVEENIVEEN
ncbi:MAG: M67 family metallopeptidase [Elusimicrobia bacterium]|nr:M67 family metallopeptidase [Elusimicrobiota bacterium]